MTARGPAETALAIFCAATVAFLVVRDLTVPEVRDVEVWLGFELHGRAAWLTAPLHWALFAYGAVAAWRAKPWLWNAAAAYLFYVALSHLVWSEASPNGQGWRIGLLQAGGFALVAGALWASRRRRRRAPPLARFLEALRAWCGEEPRLLAAALVGSQARGTARADSDVDLVLLVEHPADFVREPAWLGRFGAVVEQSVEPWGRVTSVRARYETGLEVEFGFAAPDWATAPNAGSLRVVRDGCRVLWDPARRFAGLLAEAAQGGEPR